MNFNPNCIRSLVNPRWNIQSREVMSLLGLSGGGHLPTEGMPPRNIQGYKVWVEAEPLVRTFRRAAGIKARKSSTHRVKVECHCGWIGSLGRMHQHKCLPRIEDYSVSPQATGHVATPAPLKVDKQQEIVTAVLALHNPQAQTQSMVYEVWEDGEITLTKGGDLYGQRSLHCIVPGGSTPLPVDSLPLRTFEGDHARIQCMTGADAAKARQLICGNDVYNALAAVLGKYGN